VTFAAAYEDQPRVWGVGRIVDANGVRAWPVSASDIEDEAATVAPRLTALGLGDGGLLLIVSLLSQAIHVVPLEQAAGLVGARYSSADATPFDAFRTVSLVRQLQPAVVLGIDRRVCDGIEELGHDLGGVFADVGAVVAADRDAATRLSAAGVEPGRWVRLGPTNVIAPPGEDTFGYDPARWQIDDVDGALLLTNLVERLTPCDRLATGWRGQVTEPGRLRIDG
jgi:hypothetical protein